MENQINEKLSSKLPNHKIPKIRAHSYYVYLLFFIFGVLFNIIFNFKVFKSSVSMPIGLIILILATLLIFWTQAALRDRWKQIPSKENFHRGPYCYTRSPTHLGLFLLLLGFGLIVNSFFIILFSVVAFVVGKFLFLNKEEKILIEKYDGSYLEYKKMVNF